MTMIVRHKSAAAAPPSRYISDGSVFILPSDEVSADMTGDITQSITGDMIENYIRLHQVYMLPKMQESRDMYEGRYEILTRPKKELGKPDNRIVVNMARHIVDTFNGYFIGLPVKVIADDKEVNDAVKGIREANGLDDNEAELAKMTSIYGRAYEYLYQDEDGKTRVTYSNPMNVFVVYDDTIAQRRAFGVRYWADKDNRLAGEVRTKTYDVSFATNAHGKIVLDMDNAERKYYVDVPIIEYIENEERQSIFEHVKTLMNGLNKALSEKADAVEYFADAYMYIIGAEVDDKASEKLKTDRLLNIFGRGAENIRVGFLEKPQSDEMQENLLNRISDLIYQTAMIANIQDEAYGNASGTALEFKLQPMRNLAALKSRKFKASMQERYKIIFGLQTNIRPQHADAWRSLQYQFAENMPHNLTDEIDAAVTLSSIASDRTALSIISVIDDPDAELQRIKDEQLPIDDTSDNRLRLAIERAERQEQLLARDDDRAAVITEINGAS